MGVTGGRQIMATIRRRRPFMGHGMQMVRRPRRQRGGRMYYMRRRFQKGKGILHPRAKGVTREDVMDFPLLGLLAGASYVTQKVAHSKKNKYQDQARKTNTRNKRRHDGSPGSD